MGGRVTCLGALLVLSACVVAAPGLPGGCSQSPCAPLQARGRGQCVCAAQGARVGHGAGGGRGRYQLQVRARHAGPAGVVPAGRGGAAAVQSSERQWCRGSMHCRPRAAGPTPSPSSIWHPLPDTLCSAPTFLSSRSGRSFFMCRIDLTDEGHAHAKEAVAIVFRYGGQALRAAAVGPALWAPRAPWPHLTLASHSHHPHPPATSNHTPTRYPTPAATWACCASRAASPAPCGTRCASWRVRLWFILGLFRARVG